MELIVLNMCDDFDKLSPNGVEFSPNGVELSPNGVEFSPIGMQFNSSGVELSRCGVNFFHGDFANVCHARSTA